MASRFFVLTVILTFLVITLAENADDLFDEHGFEVKERQYIDVWSNAVYIPRPDQPLAKNGTVSKWSFYARRTGLLYLQIWRKMNPYRYQLIGQDEYRVNQSGIQNVTSSRGIDAKEGDYIGFYFSGRSIVPFDGEECYTRRGLYYKRYVNTPLQPGSAYSFRKQLAGWKPCREYSLKVYQARESTREITEDYDDFGFEAKNRSHLDTLSNAAYIPRPDQKIPRNGSVAKWTFYAENTGLIYLQIWRKQILSMYELIDEVRYMVRQRGVQNVTLDAQIEVEKGDVIGFYVPEDSIVPFDGEECSSGRGLYIRPDSTWPFSKGAWYYFKEQEAGWRPCREYSLKAHLTKEKDTCCYKNYTGEAVLGTIIDVLFASVEECKENCCSNETCLSFSVVSELPDSSFCILQSSSRNDTVVKKFPFFNHYEKDKCS